jgi:hypothetical protein
MRHLWSFLAGVLVAPLTWALITLGQNGSTQTISRWVEVGTSVPANLIESTVYLAVAGILLGLIGTLRVSPLGPLVAGLLLVAPYVGLFVNPFAVRAAVPTNLRVLGDPLPLRGPLDNGTLFLIGVLLLMAMFSAKRWRRWPRPAAAEPSIAGTVAGDEPTLTDWNGPASGAAERDVNPPTLGYPNRSAPPASPPSAQASATPWSAPPRTSARQTTTE